MIAKVYLDGVEVEFPIGIEDIHQTLNYEEEIKGVLNRIEGSLTFKGDGYEYLKDLLFETGFCNSVDFRLTIEGQVYFDGIIYVADLEDMNVSRKLFKTPISNNDVSAYIYNNKQIKAYLNVTKSKNGETITAATRKTSFDLFTPATGVYDELTSWVYTVDEAFNYLVAFMTDGQMTYSSPYFGAGGDKEGICVVSGFGLRNTGATAAPFLSFFDLFNEMNKLYNISFYIDYSGALPEIVIDKSENIYTDTSLISFSSVKDLIVTIEKDKLYGRVTLGSDKTNDTLTFPVVRFLGFEEEEYHALGQCNEDTNLDLKNFYVLDSNVIEDVVKNANTDYDGDIFIIESDLPGTEQATQYDNLIPDGTFVYNLGLNNFNKSQNYLNGFPADILLFLNNEANSFEATKNSYTLSTGNIIHTTEISDPGGNYDPVTGRFAAPISGDGVYAFTFDYANLALEGATAGANMGDVYFRHYDSGGVLINEVLVKNFIMEPVTPSNSFGSVSGSFYLSATDYVRVEGVATTGTVAFGLTTFRGIFADEGGTYQAYDSNSFRILNLKFQVPITQAQFKSIRDNVTKKVTVRTSDNQAFRGWVKNLKRNILTGITEFTIKTSNNARV